MPLGSRKGGRKAGGKRWGFLVVTMGPPKKTFIFRGVYGKFPSFLGGQNPYFSWFWGLYGIFGGIRSSEFHNKTFRK